MQEHGAMAMERGQHKVKEGCDAAGDEGKRET